MPNIKVTSSLFGSPNTEETVPEVHLRLVSERISIAALITKSVAEQINTLIRAKADERRISAALHKQYLLPKDIDELTASGKISVSNPTIANVSNAPNVAVEAQRAIASFNNKQFKLFIDGQEHYDSHSEVMLKEDSQIIFLRLVPLQGG